VTTTDARPVSLRLSITDKCDQRCIYCMPAGGVELVSHEDVLSFEEFARFVRVMRDAFGLTKVHITGGEPLVRRNVVGFVSMLASQEIVDLALTTNGQRLASMATDLKKAGLHRVNVSLDSLDPGLYAEITRSGDLVSVLRGIEAARAAGLAPIKLNVVALRGCNDDEFTALAAYAFEHDCEIRFIELMPIGCAAGLFEEHFIGADEVRERLAERFSLSPLPERPGASSRSYVADDGALRGVVGFISPETHPFCAGCRRLRLTCTGQLIACLAEREGPSIRDLLRSCDERADAEIVAVARRALATKRTYPVHRNLNGREAVVEDGGRMMFKIGG